MAEREGLTRAFGPRPSGDACASSKIAFGDFVEPPFPYLGFESPLRRCQRQLIQPDENLASDWRRGRDSNPRWAFDPYALSRGAPSTTRPPLRTGNQAHSRSAGSYPSATVQVKLKGAKRLNQASSTILAAGAPDRESLPSSRLMRS